MILPGAKVGLLFGALCFGEAGAEILYPDPGFPIYPSVIRMTGATPVAYPLREERAFGLSAEDVLGRITAQTRLVIVNSPGNPTGGVASTLELDALARGLLDHPQVAILSDEIYRRLVYDGSSSPSPVGISEAGRARTLIVDGASKTYAMTGYRIGFLAGSREVIRALTNLQSQLSGCPNAISQAAYEAALISEPEEVEGMAAEFDSRRRVLVDGLRSLGLETTTPLGAFYAFPSVHPHLDDRGSEGFCEDLLEAEALAIVPGSVFGMDTHVRLSYATSLENVEEALVRLGRFLQR